MRAFARLALAVLAIALPASVSAAANTDRFARLDAALDTNFRELKMPGVSAALMIRGKLVWTGTRGWADIAARKPVTTDTPFNIASLTKPMTAVVLMQMVERGQLSLDTPMQRYDPTFTDARITVGHVLSMTSEAKPPGESYQYNGNPYGMLDTVIRGVSGETLAQAFSTRLIEPLGLMQTSPGDLAAGPQGLSAERAAHYQAIFGRVARPYNMYGGVELVPAFAPDATPNAAANVIGTASDYTRFADAVMRGRFLKPETLKAMWTAQRAPSGERFPYAYGWFVEDYAGHRLIYHYGYYPTFSAVALLVPERELVFVALSNAGGLSGHNGIDRIEGNGLACAVLIQFVDAALPCAALAASNVKRWMTQGPPREPEVASDPAMLARYAGTYRRPAGGTATVLIDQGKLYWQSSAGRFLLTQVGPHRFIMKAEGRINTFVLDDKGNVTRIDVTYHGDPNTYVVPRI
jgi:CubicO group peptidase (beta-lactamase class C family)